MDPLRGDADIDPDPTFYFDAYPYPDPDPALKLGQVNNWQIFCVLCNRIVPSIWKLFK